MGQSTVLVLAKDRFVAALLGALVDLAAKHASFPNDREPVESAIQRTHPDLILFDCALGPNECARVAVAARAGGMRFLMFSAAHTEPEVRDIAHRYGTQAFALPIKPRDFADQLDRALAVGAPAGT